MYEKKEPPKNEEPTLIQGLTALAALIFVLLLSTGQLNGIEWSELRTNAGYVIRGIVGFAICLGVFYVWTQAPRGVAPTMDATATFAAITLVVTAAFIFWPAISSFSLNELLSNLLKM